MMSRPDNVAYVKRIVRHDSAIDMIMRLCHELTSHMWAVLPELYSHANQSVNGYHHQMVTLETDHHHSQSVWINLRLTLGICNNSL